MYIKINKKNYTGLTTKLTRKATIIYSENSGTTIDNSDTLDPMGTRVNYNIVVDSMYKDQQLLEDFWNDITTPRREGFWCEMPYNQTTLKFKAYANTVSQNLSHIENGKNIWDSISVDITSKDLQFKEII